MYFFSHNLFRGLVESTIIISSDDLQSTLFPIVYIKSVRYTWTLVFWKCVQKYKKKKKNALSRAKLLF